MLGMSIYQFLQNFLAYTPAFSHTVDIDGTLLWVLVVLGFLFSFLLSDGFFLLLVVFSGVGEISFVLLKTSVNFFHHNKK